MSAAMAKFGALRLGVAERISGSRRSGTGETRVDARARQVRAGLALTSNRHGTAGPFAVSMDADLTRTPTATGDEPQHFAGRRSLAVHSARWACGAA